MIALPLFFLSNVVLALGVTISGCAIAPAIQDQPKIYMTQKGSIIFASENDYASYKIRFDYQQIGPDAYVMTLHPFLMSTIRIALTPEKEIYLSMSGVSYDSTESLAMLDAYAPAFPWQDLAKVVASGYLHDNQWAIESWDPSRIRMQYADSTVEWVVDSSTMGA
jgi:hypothetical protein